MIRKETALALREISGPLLVMDSQGNIIRVNAELARLLGLQTTDMLGRAFGEFVDGGADKLQVQLRKFAGSGDWLVGSLFLRSVANTIVNFPCQGKVLQRPLDGAPPLLVVKLHRQAEFSALNRKIKELHAEVRRRQDVESQLHLSGFALDRASDAMFWLGSTGHIEMVNEQACRVLGYARTELVGMRVGAIDPDFPAVRWPAHWQKLKQDGNLIFETSHRDKDGRIFPVEISATYLNYQGRDINFAIARDISERKLAEQAQRKLNRALRLLSDCNMTLVHCKDEQTLLDEICRLIVEIGGYRMVWVGYAQPSPAHTVRPVSSHGVGLDALPPPRTAMAGDPVCQAILDGIPHICREATVISCTAASWQGAIRCDDCRASVALPLRGEDATFGALTIYATDTDAFGADELKLLEELANDLAFGIMNLRSRAQRKAAEETLAFLAHHDALTRLPNRVLLRDRFAQAVAAAQRKGNCVALLFLDLDNFKQINDSLGHDMGDRALIQAVERLRGCVREADTISRHGGDEFIVILPDVENPQMAGAVAQKILDAFDAPFVLDGYTIHLGFSIGISLYPADGEDFDSLLKKADTAIYHAKDSGRNAFRFFTEQMNLTALEQMRYQGQLRSALRNGEFSLHYQPQIDLASGQVIGAEALIRWRHPTEGMVSPARFIPLAEQTGLIIPIGEWVLDEACRQAQAWQEAGLANLVIAVNLSALQFKRGNVLATVTATLARHRIPAHCLELELTESLLLQDVETTMETLIELKRMGVKLSIDDFGTGYSSFAYLKRLSVDRLKIDQSFIRDLAIDTNRAIVKAIVQLGLTLQLSVLAEGVETEDQLKILRDFGCSEVQGYLFSRPLPADGFADWLVARR